MTQPILDPKVIEAEENLLIDFHFLLQELMAEKGISQSELAEMAGLSKPRLTQILSSEANPTIKSIARLFYALKEQVCLSRKPLPAEEKPTASGSEKPNEWQWGKGVPPEDRKDEKQLVRMMKDNFASNDNHVPHARVMFIASEVALAPDAPDAVLTPDADAA